MQDYPEKDSYKLSELCQYTDTQPYVIRFWESEFPQFRDGRTPAGGQRTYQRSDIDLVRRIKQLLYEEEYTLAGARERLEQELAGRPIASAGRALESADVREPVERKVRSETAVGLGPRPLPLDTVPRERYDRAVEEIELLRLKLKEAEREVKLAESARVEAEGRAERAGEARKRARARIETLLRALMPGTRASG